MINENLTLKKKIRNDIDILKLFIVVLHIMFFYLFTYFFEVCKAYAHAESLYAALSVMFMKPDLYIAIPFWLFYVNYKYIEGFIIIESAVEFAKTYVKISLIIIFIVILQMLITYDSWLVDLLLDINEEREISNVRMFHIFYPLPFSLIVLYIIGCLKKDLTGRWIKILGCSTIIMIGITLYKIYWSLNRCSLW